MRRDWIAGAVLLAFSGGYFLVASSINRSQLSDVVGAAAFPMALAAALAVLSCVLILTGALKKAPAAAHEEKAAEAAKDLHGFARAGGTLAIGLALVLVIPYTGYIIGIALLLLAMLMYFHEPFSWRIALFSAAGSIVLWLLFKVMFEVPVPSGVWPDLLKLLFHK